MNFEEPNLRPTTTRLMKRPSFHHIVLLSNLNPGPFHG